MSEPVSGSVELSYEFAELPSGSPVTLWAGGTRIGVDETAPYEFVWDTTESSEGATTVFAVAQVSPEESVHSGEFDVTVNNVPDADGDGLADELEVVLGFDLSSDDPDGDGLSEAFEARFIDAGLDPAIADTDGDGISDGAEDFDGDGWDNLREATEGTDPTLPDTDFDGLIDSEEFNSGTSPTARDSDDDGLLDGSEAALGTDPTLSDTDLDGVLDGDEALTLSTEPLEGVALELTGSGDLVASLSAQDVSSSPALRFTGGELSPAIDLDLSEEAEFVSATVTFSFDPALVDEAADVGIVRWDPSLHLWLPASDLETQVVDVSLGEISAELLGFSTYQAVDLRAWRDSFIKPDCGSTDDFDSDGLRDCFEIGVDAAELSDVGPLRTVEIQLPGVPVQPVSIPEPADLAVSLDGQTIYASVTEENRILSINTENGVVSTFANVEGPTYLSVSPNGVLYAVTPGANADDNIGFGTVWRVSSGGASAVATGDPAGVAVDSSGAIYVIENGLDYFGESWNSWLSVVSGTSQTELVNWGPLAYGRDLDVGDGALWWNVEGRLWRHEIGGDTLNPSYRNWNRSTVSTDGNYFYGSLRGGPFPDCSFRNADDVRRLDLRSFPVLDVEEIVAGTVQGFADGDDAEPLGRLCSESNAALAMTNDVMFISDPGNSTIRFVEIGYQGGDTIWTVTDPNDPDTDDDGLLDGEEFREFTINDVAQLTQSLPISSEALARSLGLAGPDSFVIVPYSDPRVADTDGDGLDDPDEVAAGTDAFDEDTDGDNRTDGFEDQEGTDPNVFDDYYGQPLNITTPQACADAGGSHWIASPVWSEDAQRVLQGCYQVEGCQGGIAGGVSRWGCENRERLIDTLTMVGAVAGVVSVVLFACGTTGCVALIGAAGQAGKVTAGTAVATTAVSAGGITTLQILGVSTLAASTSTAVLAEIYQQDAEDRIYQRLLAARPEASPDEERHFRTAAKQCIDEITAAAPPIVGLVADFGAAGLEAIVGVDVKHLCETRVVYMPGDRTETGGLMPQTTQHIREALRPFVFDDVSFGGNVFTATAQPYTIASRPSVVGSTLSNFSWMRLNYSSAGVSPSDWYDSFPTCAGRAGLNTRTVCDEFPFASTTQGGPRWPIQNASLRLTALVEGSNQGGDLSNIPRESRCARTDAESEYYVIPIPTTYRLPDPGDYPNPALNPEPAIWHRSIFLNCPPQS